jgi:hypothetical protein
MRSEGGELLTSMMDGIQIVVAFVLVGLAYLGSSVLRDKQRWWLANSLVFAVSLIAMWSGPRFLGSDWLYQGFPAGWILGSFMDVFGHARDFAVAQARSKELQEELERLKVTT